MEASTTLRGFNPPYLYLGQFLLQCLALVVIVVGVVANMPMREERVKFNLQPISVPRTWKRLGRTNNIHTQHTIKIGAARGFLMISNLRRGCTIIVGRSSFRPPPRLTTNMLDSDRVGNVRNHLRPTLITIRERFVNAPLPPTASHIYLLHPDPHSVPTVSTLYALSFVSFPSFEESCKSRWAGSITTATGRA